MALLISTFMILSFMAPVLAQEEPPPEEPPPEGYTCPECGQTFPTISEIESHMQSAHAEWMPPEVDWGDWTPYEGYKPPEDWYCDPNWMPPEGWFADEFRGPRELEATRRLGTAPG